MRIDRVLLTLLASLTGCSCAHEPVAEDDVGTAVDAASDVGPVPDVDATAEHFFTLERATQNGIWLTHERCGETEGATTLLRADVLFDQTQSCQTPGPIDIGLDAATRSISGTANAWVEHVCAFPSAGGGYERDVAVTGLTAGTWTLPGGRTFVVAARPTSACDQSATNGAGCLVDCDCQPGLACVAPRGAGACARVCADPCENVGIGTDFGLTCPAAAICRPLLVPNASVCEAFPSDQCSSTDPCPAGLSCATGSPRFCTWSVTLSSATRHACVTETDCDRGLDCVQRRDGTRRCEVRCQAGDMTCPDARVCVPGEWVCE